MRAGRAEAFEGLLTATQLCAFEADFPTVLEFPVIQSQFVWAGLANLSGVW